MFIPSVRYALAAKKSTAAKYEHILLAKIKQTYLACMELYALSVPIRERHFLCGAYGAVHVVSIELRTFVRGNDNEACFGCGVHGAMCLAGVSLRILVRDRER